MFGWIRRFRFVSIMDIRKHLCVSDLWDKVLFVFDMFGL